MSFEDKLDSVQGALSGFLKGLPEGSRQKLVDCETMQRLWEMFPESVKRLAAPSTINRIQKGEVTESVCEVWIEDALVKEAILREKSKMLRELAEKTGRVAIENLSFKIVRRDKLRELLSAIES
jgi:hypothetical protein